jgi:hypothetical protein
VKRLFVVATSVAVFVGAGVTGAFAGEVKGPPYQGDPVPGGIATPDNSTPATLGGKAQSLCAYSGLNDFDSTMGQTDKQTQTPADGPPGAPGHGIQVAPGVVVSCKGNASGG